MKLYDTETIVYEHEENAVYKYTALDMCTYFSWDLYFSRIMLNQVR